MNYVQFHVGDWDSSTRLLSPLEKGIYIDLLMLYYSTEKPIIRSYFERITKVYTKEERKAFDFVISEFFEEREDGFHQRRCDEEIAKAKEKSMKAKKSIQARWARVSQTFKQSKIGEKTECERDTDVIRTNNERNTDVILTNNQEPIYKESIKKASAVTHRFDLQAIPSEWKRYANKIRPDLDAEKEFTSFAFYFSHGKGSSKLRSDKGWSQAWQGWVRRAKEHALATQPTNIFTVIKPRQPANRDDDFYPDFDMGSFGVAK